MKKNVRTDFKVVLDACVLIPMPLADTLLRLAGARLYLPKWTDQIMGEVARNLGTTFGLSEDQLKYRENEIRRHFPEAWVHSYEDIIPAMTNDPKDRHVLAAAGELQSRVDRLIQHEGFPPGCA